MCQFWFSADKDTGTAGMEKSACGGRNGVGCTAGEPSTKTLGMAAVVPTQSIDHNEKCGCE